MQNIDIRMLVSDRGIYYKDIAKVMGVTHRHLSRLMSRELKPETRARILNAIDSLEVRKEQ